MVQREEKFYASLVILQNPNQVRTVCEDKRWKCLWSEPMCACLSYSCISCSLLCFFLTHFELPCLGRKNLCMLLTSKQVYKLIQRAVILKIFLCLMCTAAKLLFLYKLIYCISDRCLCLGNFISQSGKMRPNSCNLLCPICHWNSNCLFPIIQGAIWRN